MTIVPLVVIMARAPVAGRVKTRLARQAGVAAATRFYRSCIEAVCDRLMTDRRWRIEIALTPDRDVVNSYWRKRIPLRPQGLGDLGRRLERLLALPLGQPILVIGSDVPALARAHVWRAIKALSHSDTVLGPAPDGGYWLIGSSKRYGRRLDLSLVRWSTETALSDTRSCLSDRCIALVDTLGDVDTLSDARRYAHHAGRRIVHPFTSVSFGS